MENFFKYAADIITAAATSPWGILALIVLIVGVLAYLLFRNASEKTKVTIFVLVLVSGAAFGAVVLDKSFSMAEEKARTAAVDTLAATAPSSTPVSPRESPKEDWSEARWEEARNNIRWIFQDAGAKRTYDTARARGLSKYNAALASQGHNANAQGTIAEYGEVRTEKYIASLGH